MTPSQLTGTEFLLSPWQKVQAAMLYHYASLDYLRALHAMVTDLIDGRIEPLLQHAKSEGRDSYLVDAQWGTRDTSANWANHAWPFFKQLQASLAKDIADRALERYGFTDVFNCLRGAQEFSLRWTTPDEEEQLEKILRMITNHAVKIDYTCDDYSSSKWKDSTFASYFSEFAKTSPQIPKFRVRIDVAAVTDKPPKRTGVYVSSDDPHAALQFAWAGGRGGRLRPSQTFSEIGLDALKSIGRCDLWFNEGKMLDFALADKNRARFQKRMTMLDKFEPWLASSAISHESFVQRPCSWFFVEIINGEYEPIEFCEPAQRDVIARQHVPGGGACPEAGYYFTPARRESRRYFAVGEVMPDFKSDYGETFWQWDWVQS